ncbi:amino acid ABC transporter permease [Clostridiaceae bacterium OttesenSCG-928-D20]|nr:amino acid ABC transporter permease [Clostridiaceae bacterium OttesenSCG-928-D20]
MDSWFEDFKNTFYRCFIEDNRWEYIVKGLGATLTITFFALLMGVIIGVVVAIVRVSHDKQIGSVRSPVARFFLKLANSICQIYLTVIRGTPVVVQLLIMTFVILVFIRNSIVVASLTFGINSGAYVAEIIRAGIMSVDNGQMEAGRSLGFSYIKTMRYIILPQAFKAVLPSLANEFIVLLKETSVAGYVGIIDLTRGGDIIRGRTFVAFMPLFAVALIYLAMVMFFSYLVSKLERRLRADER